MEVVDQVTTLILMEEQVTETVFGCIKLIIWKKLSKFIQVSCSIYVLSMILILQCTN